MADDVCPKNEFIHARGAIFFIAAPYNSIGQCRAQLRNPIILEHVDALALLSDQPVRVSTLNATAIILTSLGADQILIPVPGVVERNRVVAGLRTIPSSRRGLIKPIDADGKMLSRVSDFLMPMTKQARKHPENSFVKTSIETLYNLALGCKYGATIASGAMNELVESIPVIDLSLFTGEVRYRLSELIFMASRYDPSLMSRNEVIGQVSEADVRSLFWKIIDSAEYTSVVTISGRLGLARHPAVLLHSLERAIKNLVTRPEFKVAIRAGEVAAQLAKFPVSFSGLGELTDNLKRGPGFAPPFIELPVSTEYRIAEASLKESFPGATFPKSMIFADERILGNVVFHRWLNKGEESVLEYPPQQTLKRLRKSAVETRRVAAGLGRQSYSKTTT
jgi:hypothetical protein